MVDWDGLENRCAGNGTVGSNPTLSATAFCVWRRVRGRAMVLSMDDGEEKSLPERLARYWWLAGIVALAAWFAMLWFMFGDVL